MGFLRQCQARVRSVVLMGLTMAAPIPAQTVPPTIPWVRNLPGNSAAIVFVHGVLGDAHTTWTSGNQNWPSMLTHDPTFDGQNIYVYQYPSPRLNRAFSIDEIADNMRLVLSTDGVLRHKDLTFVSHSMGGLVTRAFILKYRSIVPTIRLLYFFATPTTGSPYAILASIVSRNTQFKQLYPMEADSYLGPLQSNWLAAKLGLKSYCAYETQPLYGQIIVERQSATNLCTERLDPIDADHVTIVKPTDQNSNAYRALKSAFEETASHGRPAPVKEAVPKIKASSRTNGNPRPGPQDPSASISTPPFSRTPQWNAALARVTIPDRSTLGTAFVVSVKNQKAYLVTSARLLAGFTSDIRIEFQVDPDAPPLRATVRNIQSDDLDHGLALLVVTDPPAGVLALPSYGGAKPASGDRVLMAGYSTSFKKFLTVEAPVAGPDAQDLILSTNAEDGFFGGPILSGGAAVGMLFGHRPPLYSLTMIADVIKLYLAGLEIPWGDVAAGNFATDLRAGILRMGNLAEFGRLRDLKGTKIVDRAYQSTFCLNGATECIFYVTSNQSPEIHCRFQGGREKFSELAALLKSSLPAWKHDTTSQNSTERLAGKQSFGSFSLTRQSSTPSEVDLYFYQFP